MLHNLPVSKHPNSPNRVYRLHKALYGLKQAPRAWYEKSRDFSIHRMVLKLGK